MNNWWKSATTEQRIAQVKGAIEIGLTQRETALLLGCGKSNIAAFASKHKLSFGGRSSAYEKMGVVAKEVRAHSYRKLNAERYRDGYSYDSHEIFPREQDVFLEDR